MSKLIKSRKYLLIKEMGVYDKGREKEYLKEFFKFEEFLKNKKVKRLAMQIEVGGEQSSVHIQAFVRFKQAQSMTFAKKIGCVFKVPFKDEDDRNCIKYCLKKESVLNREYFVNWCEKKGYLERNAEEDIVLQKRVSTEKKLEIEKSLLYLAYIYCKKFNKLSNNRSVFFFYDEIGGLGKSTFGNYLIDRGNIVMDMSSYNEKELKEGYCSLIEQMGSLYKRKEISFVADFPRVVGAEGLKGVCSTAESVKNGRLIDLRYETKMPFLPNLTNFFVFLNRFVFRNKKEDFVVNFDEMGFENGCEYIRDNTLLSKDRIVILDFKRKKVNFLKMEKKEKEEYKVSCNIFNGITYGYKYDYNSVTMDFVDFFNYVSREDGDFSSQRDEQSEAKFGDQREPGGSVLSDSEGRYQQ